MLKKIGTEQLTLGVRIHDLCGSWMDHPFWRSKIVITNPKDLRRLQESCITELWIDVSKGLDVAVAEPREQATMPTEPVRRGEPPKQVSMAEELERAGKICARAKEAVALMFHEVRMGNAISSEAAGEVVEEIASSVMRNPGASLASPVSRPPTAIPTCTRWPCVR